MNSDIISDIDALIDDQLDAGEPPAGYSHGDPTYPKCPHCGRHWHGLPITEQIAFMYAFGEYDDQYRAQDDDSQILCSGSDFIGPMPNEMLNVDTMIAAAMQRISSMYSLFSYPTGTPWPLPAPDFDMSSWGTDNRRWWQTTMPTDTEYTYEAHLHSPDTFTIRCGGHTRAFDTAHIALFNDGRRVALHARNLMHAMANGVTIAVLADTAPDIGGTWVPLTAPGVTDLDEHQADDGQHIAIVGADGHIMHARVTHAETIGDTTTLTCDPIANQT